MHCEGSEEAAHIPEHWYNIRCRAVTAWVVTLSFMPLVPFETHFICKYLLFYFTVYVLNFFRLVFNIFSFSVELWIFNSFF